MSIVNGTLDRRQDLLEALNLTENPFVKTTMTRRTSVALHRIASTRSAASLPLIVALLLLSAAGCAPHAPATPEPLAPQPSINTLVHIDNADPTLPLALFRIELELSGERYRRLVGSSTGSMGPKEDRSSPLDDVHVTAQTTACLAPCDVLVSSFPGQKFFLGGDGIVPSAELRLDPGLGNVHIDAKPKSSAWKYGGDTLVALGAVGERERVV